VRDGFHDGDGTGHHCSSLRSGTAQPCAASPHDATSRHDALNLPARSRRRKSRLRTPVETSVPTHLLRMGAGSRESLGDRVSRRCGSVVSSPEVHVVSAAVAHRHPRAARLALCPGDEGLSDGRMDRWRSRRSSRNRWRTPPAGAAGRHSPMRTSSGSGTTPRSVCVHRLCPVAAPARAGSSVDTGAALPGCCHGLRARPARRRVMRA